MKILKGFTLVEMLIVLGIVAILVAVVVSVLNPAEFFRQTRDSRRLSDLNQLDQALNLATLDNVSMGTANVVYVSVPDDSAGATTTCSTLGLPDIAPWTYQCSNSTNYRKVDGTGWVPVDFSSLVTVPSALSVLPVDPTNSTSTGLYYTYVNGSWELTTLFESTKYSTKYLGVTATSTVYSLGNHTNISPNAIATRTGTGGGGTTQYTLTVNKTGDGSGTVTSNPSGIDCGSTCSYDFDDDTEVTLTAEAAGGSTFTAWSGEGCSGTGTCVVTLSEDREVTANFDVAGPQAGYIDPNGDGDTLQWSRNPGPTHYGGIDDGVRSPDTPDTGDYIDANSDFVTDRFTMTSIPGVSSVSNVTVWGYGRSDFYPDDKVNIRIYMGGEWTTSSYFAFSDSDSWSSVSFDGEWTQDDLDGILVDVFYTKNLDRAWLYALYAEVTYTQ
ncbi:MAG: prepilin-type N-terminal cleavage/methylation domain-containing protein [Candidatus Omnitrophota bacterium]